MERGEGIESNAYVFEIHLTCIFHDAHCLFYISDSLDSICGRIFCQKDSTDGTKPARELLERHRIAVEARMQYSFQCRMKYFGQFPDKFG